MAEDYDISKLLSTQFLPLDGKELDASYQKSASGSGEKKAQRYEKFLKDALPARLQGTFAFLSIGGADGSEIEYVSSKFSFSQYIICEISDEAVRKAHALSEKLAERGLTLHVIHGDIWSVRHEIEAIVKDTGCHGIVVSAQSVLHELPTRSSQEDFAPQLMQLISYADDTILLTSDPTGNTGNWPASVRISCPRIPPDDLFQLSSLIHRQYFSAEKKPEKIGSITYCSSKLALEVFYKIAHFDGNTRLKYEMGECLTHFPRQQIERILGAYGFVIETQMWQSDRLRRSFDDYFVVQSAESSDPLPLPETFLSIFAKKKVKSKKVTSQNVSQLSVVDAVYCHFLDHHFLEQALNGNNDIVYEAVRLAFRISLIFGRRLLVPFTSYVESEICRGIVDEHCEIFSFGVFDLTGSSLTIEQALAEAELHYQNNPERLARYRAFHSRSLPPYVRRKASATTQLIDRWNEFSRTDDPTRHFGRDDKSVAHAIEKNWDSVTGSLGGQAMIAENVASVLFDGRKDHPVRIAADALTIFLGDEYFAAVSKEFKAHVFADVPYMANTLAWGDFKKLNYRVHLDLLGPRLVGKIRDIEPRYLLEEVEKIRDQLVEEGALRTTKA